MVNRDSSPAFHASDLVFFKKLLQNHTKKKRERQTMSKLDVLTLIRGAINAKVGHQIVCEEGDVLIPSSTGMKQFVATGKTSYKDRSTKEMITVGSLFNMVQAGIHTGTNFADYKKNPDFKEKVGVLDWMELKRYLTGEIETSKQIMNGDEVDDEGNDGKNGSGGASGSARGNGAGGAGNRSGSGGASSSSGGAQTSQLLMAAERSLKRKRELIEGSGMTEEEASKCAERAKKQESSTGTRTTVLDVVQGDFSEVLAAHKAVTKSHKKSKATKAEEKNKRVPKYPIILVSESTSQAKVSMWNVLSFLQEGRYMTIKEAKQNAPPGSKEPKQHAMVHNNVTYRILPIKSTLNDKIWSDNDFSRVVGLFVDGSTWGYKKWCTKMPLVDIFSSTAGFHVHFADEKAHPNCQKWIVDKVVVDKNNRYMDAVAVEKIWRKINGFIAGKMPEYMAENWQNPHKKK